jgi:hypothetical protein
MIRFVYPPVAAATVDADTGELVPHILSGVTVFQRNCDGYVNAAAMCQATGKRMNHCLRNDTTKAFLDVTS